jgi:predicted dehydrogenase
LNRARALVFLTLAVLIPGTAGFAFAADTAPANPMAVDIVARLRAAAQAEPDPSKRAAVLRAAASELPRGLYPPVLDLLIPAPPDTHDREIARAIFLRWAWETPDYAAAWAAAAPRGPFRQEALAEAAGRWAEKQPGEVASWSETLPPRETAWVRSSVSALLHRLRSPALAAWDEAIRPPVRLAVYGLEHDHARLLFPSLAGRRDVVLVGVIESDPAEIAYYEQHFHLDPHLFYPSLAALRAATPAIDAVAVFTSTFRHREAVEQCAPLGIDVMMEKPFAMDLAAARAMRDAARRGGIDLIVNYETSWYPSTRQAHEWVDRDHVLGPVRKILVRDGNGGPLSPAIDCTPFFKRWLLDPARGGGALLDFGCYGADLVTWMMEGREPTSVTAVTQHFQAALPAAVEDEATVIVTYPDAQAIIQASWNWPYGRKDMEIYGENGSLKAPGRDVLLERHGERGSEVQSEPPALQGPDRDSLSYLVAVVRKRIRPSGLASVETNMVVTEILDAARESARTGRRVEVGTGP